MGPGDWRTTPLGRQAIGRVSQALGNYLRDLEVGFVDQVLVSLDRPYWRTSYDWAGVPQVMLDRLDQACADVTDLLHGDDPDIAGAQETIGRALDYWLDQPPGPDPPANWASP